MPNTELTPELFNQLIHHGDKPCVSIYQDARLYPHGSDQAQRAYRNALRQIESKLRQRLADDQYPAFTKPLYDLCEDISFWPRKTYGRAIFRSPGLFAAIHVARRVPEIAVVADSFHTKPLIRQLNTAGRYQVLCLSQQTVALYEGNRDGLEKVELHPSVPRSLQETAGERTDEIHRSVTSHGGPNRTPVSFAHEDKSALLDNELMHYFREVDRGIKAHHSRDNSLPLILCAPTKYHDLFARVSKNDRLLARGIHLNPDGISLERLSQEAWKLIEPGYHEQTSRLIDDFNVAKARNTASEDPVQVAQAAAQGRVSALLVDADKTVSGRIHDDGHVELAPPGASDVDDLLDDAAERVLRTGGRVMVLPSTLMPTNTGVAAIYRY